MTVKISIKTTEGKVLYYTTEGYTIQENLITFTDKFGAKQTWNTKNVINIKEVAK